VILKVVLRALRRTPSSSCSSLALKLPDVSPLRMELMKLVASFVLTFPFATTLAVPGNVSFRIWMTIVRVAISNPVFNVLLTSFKISVAERFASFVRPYWNLIAMVDSGVGLGVAIVGEKVGEGDGCGVGIGVVGSGVGLFVGGNVVGGPVGSGDGAGVIGCDVGLNVGGNVVGSGVVG